MTFVGLKTMAASEQKQQARQHDSFWVCTVFVEGSKESRYLGRQEKDELEGCWNKAISKKKGSYVEVALFLGVTSCCPLEMI